MTLTLEASGIAPGLWLEQYARTSLGFALSNRQVDVGRVCLSIDAEHAPARRGFTRCGIAAETTLGTICAGSVGSDPREAIREASLQLEAALFERSLVVRGSAAKSA